jgi:hypothetical protein
VISLEKYTVALIANPPQITWNTVFVIIALSGAKIHRMRRKKRKSGSALHLFGKFCPFVPIRGFRIVDKPPDLRYNE